MLFHVVGLSTLAACAAAQEQQGPAASATASRPLVVVPAVVQVLSADDRAIAERTWARVHAAGIPELAGSTWWFGRAISATRGNILVAEQEARERANSSMRATSRRFSTTDDESDPSSSEESLNDESMFGGKRREPDASARVKDEAETKVESGDERRERVLALCRPALHVRLSDGRWLVDLQDVTPDSAVTRDADLLALSATMAASDINARNVASFQLKPERFSAAWSATLAIAAQAGAIANYPNPLANSLIALYRWRSGHGDHHLASVALIWAPRPETRRHKRVLGELNLSYDSVSDEADRSQCNRLVPLLSSNSPATSSATPAVAIPNLRARLDEDLIDVGYRLVWNSASAAGLAWLEHTAAPHQRPAVDRLRAAFREPTPSGTGAMARILRYQRREDADYNYPTIGLADVPELIAALGDDRPSPNLEYIDDLVEVRSRGRVAAMYLAWTMRTDPRRWFGLPTEGVWSDEDHQRLATAMNAWWQGRSMREFPKAIQELSPRLSATASLSLMLGLESMLSNTERSRTSSRTSGSLRGAIKKMGADPAPGLLKQAIANLRTSIAQRITAAPWSGTAHELRHLLAVSRSRPVLANAIATWPVSGTAERPLALWHAQVRNQPQFLDGVLDRLDLDRAPSGVVPLLAEQHQRSDAAALTRWTALIAHSATRASMLLAAIERASGGNDYSPSNSRDDEDMSGMSSHRFSGRSSEARPTTPVAPPADRANQALRLTALAILLGDARPAPGAWVRAARSTATQRVVRLNDTTDDDVVFAGNDGSERSTNTNDYEVPTGAGDVELSDQDTLDAEDITNHNAHSASASASVTAARDPLLYDDACMADLALRVLCASYRELKLPLPELPRAASAAARIASIAALRDQVALRALRARQAAGLVMPIPDAEPRTPPLY